MLFFLLTLSYFKKFIIYRFFLLFGFLDVATLYCSFFISFTEFFHSSTTWFFLVMSVFWLCIVFLISLTHLSVFYSWLSFLKTPILNSLLGKLWIAVSLITGRSLWTFGDVMFPLFFHVSGSFTLLFLHLKLLSSSLIFMSCLVEKNFVMFLIQILRLSFWHCDTPAQPLFPLCSRILKLVCFLYPQGCTMSNAR